MANPLFNSLGENRMPGPFGNLQQMQQQFNQFRQTFQGDPRQEVEKMLQDGRISQADLNRAQQMARQLMGVLK